MSWSNRRLDRAAARSRTARIKFLRLLAAVRGKRELAELLVARFPRDTGFLMFATALGYLAVTGLALRLSRRTAECAVAEAYRERQHLRSHGGGD